MTGRSRPGRWLVAGTVSMLVLLSVAVFQMLFGGLKESIVRGLHDAGLSESLALMAGDVLFGGLLVVPSVVVLLTTGVLVWTGVSASETRLS